MRIYLDTCCFNRPYDDQSSFRISMETQAKLYVQEQIRQGNYELVCSYVSDYENSKNRDLTKKYSIKSYQDEFCKYYVPAERRRALQGKIKEIIGYGVAYKDAAHLACAIYAGCDYFLTTDVRLQKRYNGIEIKVVNPLEFVSMFK